MSNSSSKDVHVPLRLRIDATRQLLEVLRDGEGVQELIRYRLQNSASALKLGSNKTPLGWFAVAQEDRRGLGHRRRV